MTIDWLVIDDVSDYMLLSAFLYISPNLLITYVKNSGGLPIVFRFWSMGFSCYLFGSNLPAFVNQRHIKECVCKCLFIPKNAQLGFEICEMFCRGGNYLKTDAQKTTYKLVSLFNICTWIQSQEIHTKTDLAANSLSQNMTAKLCIESL